MNPLIILGTGLAGYTVAREFRKHDAATPITLISRDDGSAYSKPMLSNALAMQKPAAALANFSAAAMERQLNATILTKRSVERIDLPASEIVLSACGRRLPYGQLVLALGAEPRRLALAGSGAADILSVNDLRDYSRFREALDGCGKVAKVAIFGAGLIGCEFANDLASAGHAVALIDPAAAPLSRLVPEQLGAVFADALRRHGVRFHLGRTPVAVERRTGGYQVMLADGGSIEADLVLSAVGLAPRTALAREAGIATDAGIVADAYCRTSAPGVHALGDCAQIDGRLQPYVLPIMHAARALALTLSGTATPVAFPVMPVSVKTPALPTVLAAPLGGAGRWLLESLASPDASWRAVCRDPASGRTTGFTLMGAEAVKGKAALLLQMAAP